MTDRQRIPHRLLLQLVDEFQVFGQVVRLRLIEYLQGGSATPQEITDELGLSQQNVSKHLQVLFKAGVVSRRRQGSSVLHALADERAVQILEVMVSRASDQIAELSRLMSGDVDIDEHGDKDEMARGEADKGERASGREDALAGNDDSRSRESGHDTNMSDLR